MEFNTENHNKVIENDDLEAIESFKKLLNNIHSLKNKKYGCPWQKIQTHKTLLPYLIEESYEFINSIENKDITNAKEELGDVLFQILLHAEISNENEEFHIKDVINVLNKKIILRHPYIFKDRQNISLEEAQQIWNTIKTNELQNKNELSISGNLNYQLEHLPATQGTVKISLKAKEYGYKEDNIEDIFEKLTKEIKALKYSIQSKNNIQIEKEIGDILFALINLSIFLKVNPENALRASNKKFIKRLSIIEEILGDRMEVQSIEKFQELWEIAKEKTKKV